jgi:cbb3-type cytochrome oxidase subunit 3
MYQEFFAKYADSGVLALPLIGMFLFLIAFVAIVVWVTYGLKDSALPQYMATLPLNDDPSVAGMQEDCNDG